VAGKIACAGVMYRRQLQRVRRLFRGKGAVMSFVGAKRTSKDYGRCSLLAQCNACHRDGGPGEDPLFTDFAASNIGTPANPRLPYYAENRPDAFGYVANPDGPSFVVRGVGTFLTKGASAQQPLRSGSTMAQAGARQLGSNSGADATQG
jgi:hypothetical protein